ncbi:MAG: GNAT family N-acetyltransferase [Candidatus Anammoximicrobium sp.]|nr:GNAT family N-acetyltransferase [Candidatus Anammoximicrobium sp.]
MGLTYFKRFLMEIDLSGRLSDAAQLPSAYRLVPWDEALLEAHADVKYRCFHAEIDAHVFPSLGYPEGCLRLMRDITGGESFLPQATWLLACTDPRNSRVDYCGTIQGLRDGDRRGSVQNFGVVPAHRGRGLGTVLLQRSLEGFRAAGVGRVTLEVTAENQDAQRLYQRLGFRCVRTVYKTAEVAYA